MTKIKISKDHIEIKGHAMFDEYGKDIVCAALSSIVIISINGILSIDKDSIEYKQSEGLMVIDILKHTKEVDALILNMINLLKELKLQYKKNIQIEEV